MINTILNLLYQNKALDIKILNKKHSYADYIIIVTGTSDRHIINLMNNVVKNVKKNVITIAGKNTNWIIVDMGTITLHIMSKLSRELYNLESLYIDFQ